MPPGCSLTITDTTLVSNSTRCLRYIKSTMLYVLTKAAVNYAACMHWLYSYTHVVCVYTGGYFECKDLFVHVCVSFLKAVCLTTDTWPYTVVNYEDQLTTSHILR